MAYELKHEDGHVPPKSNTRDEALRCRTLPELLRLVRPCSLSDRRIDGGAGRSDQGHGVECITKEAIEWELSE